MPALSPRALLSILPSRRLLLVAAGVSLLFLASAPAALLADAVLLLLVAMDVLLTARPGELRVERHSPRRLALGGTGRCEVSVENRSPRPVRLRVTDDLPEILGREGDEVREAAVAPGGTAALGYGLRALRRGDAAVGDLHLRVLGPLGLVWTQRRLPRADPLRVQPGVLEVRRYRLLGLRNRLREAGFRSVRQRGEGRSFESLREYVRGDDPRVLDWKATARRGSLIVRQYEVERRQNVMIAIDAGRLMTQQAGGRERIDYVLSSALLLADVASQHGDHVGLLTFAGRVEQYLPPARVHLPRLADALGAVQARMVEPNYPAAFTYLATQLRRRSLLVLFTDLIDPDASAALVAHLGRAAARHVVIAVTLRNPDLEAAATLRPDSDAGVYRRAAAEELLQARANALHAMQRAGVLVADARPRDAVPAVVNRYLDVKRRGLL